MPPERIIIPLTLLSVKSGTVKLFSKFEIKTVPNGEKAIIEIKIIIIIIISFSRLL
ncbi:hypothetical protein OAU47_05260 [Pelagibacterales bacterium]|nr:hypothetical protein [Pelagibacterales bacterium]